MGDTQQEPSGRKTRSKGEKSTWMQQGTSTTIHALPASVLQEIFTGRSQAKDLARLEAASLLFRVPSGDVRCGSKLSIAEAAAYHSCHQTHPVFENFPPPARSELLAKCNGSWKQVLHFLQCVQRSSGQCTTSPYVHHNGIVATTSGHHMLIVNGNGELFMSGHSKLCKAYHDALQRLESPLRLIWVQPNTNRIIQISASYYHAAFVTENGQIFSFGINSHSCCGVGSQDELILEPALVTALEGTPCKQVTTGCCFTIALTRSGELYSWGCNNFGQLGHGNTCSGSIPQQIIVPIDGGTSDPVVQVSARHFHAAAVTKAGRMFTWGCGSSGRLGHKSYANELRPKQVEHGGFAELFIVSVSAGIYNSAAIDSLGQVYIWGYDKMISSNIPVLIDTLKDKRVVQVVAAYRRSFVLLDNGIVHYLGKSTKLEATLGSSIVQIGCFTVNGHKIQSIVFRDTYGIMVTMEGAMFIFGENLCNHLGAGSENLLEFIDSYFSLQCKII